MATLIQIPTIIKLQPRIFSIWWNTTYYLFPIVGLGRLVPALKYALHKQFLNTEVYAILVTDNISTTKPVLQLIKGSGNVSLLHFASIHHLPPFWQHIYKTVHNCMETVCNFLNRVLVQTWGSVIFGMHVRMHTLISKLWWLWLFDCTGSNIRTMGLL